MIEEEEIQVTEFTSTESIIIDENLEMKQKTYGDMIEEQEGEVEEVPKSEELKMDDGSNTVELCNTTTETIIQQKSQWGNETNEALGGAVHHPLMAMYLEPFKLNPIK